MMRRLMLIVMVAAMAVGCKAGMLRTDDPAAIAAPAGVAEENAGLRPRKNPLRVGAEVPPFMLIDQRGVAVSSGELMATKGALLVFTPGVEMGSTKAAAVWSLRNQSVLAQRGVELLLITPNTQDENGIFAAAQGVRVGVLADPERWVTRSFGATGVTSFVIGRDGRIQMHQVGLPDSAMAAMAADSLPGAKGKSFLDEVLER